MPSRLFSTLIVALALPRLATATTATDVCPPGADPCIVTKTITVAPGSTLDLGTRALDVKSTGSLNVAGGTMTILAGSVLLEPGATLDGSEVGSALPTIVVTTPGRIVV